MNQSRTQPRGIDHAANLRNICFLLAALMLVQAGAEFWRYLSEQSFDNILLGFVLILYSLVLVATGRAAVRGRLAAATWFYFIFTYAVYALGQLFMQETPIELLDDLNLLCMLGVAILVVPPHRVAQVCMAIFGTNVLLGFVDLYVPSIDSGYDAFTRIVIHVLLSIFLAGILIITFSQYRLMPLRIKLISACILIVLIPATVISTTLNARGNQHIVEKEQNNLTTVVNNARDTVRNFLGQRRTIAAAAAADPEIIQHLAGRPGDIPIAKELETLARNDVGFYRGSFLLDREGKLVEKHGAIDEEMLGPVRAGMQGQPEADVYWHIPGPDEDPIDFFLLYAVKNEGETVGWLGTDINMSPVQEGAREFLDDQYPDSVFLVADSHDRVIAASPEIDDLHDLPRGIADALENAGSVAGVSAPSERSYMAYAGVVPVIGWRLLVGRPALEALAPVVAESGYATFLATLFTAIAVAFAIAIAEYLSRPILALQAVVSDWREGEANILADDSRPDELGQLGAAFNRLSARLSDTVVGLRERVGELAEARDELARNEASLRQINEYAPTGMAIVEPAGTIVDVNPALCDWLNYSRNDLVGADFGIVSYPEDTQETLEQIGELVAGRQSVVRLRKRYRRSDGSGMMGILSVSLVRDPNGDPAHYIAQVIDVTRDVEREAALAASEHERRLVFENAPYGMAVLDADTAEHQDINLAYSAMFGYSREEIIGMNAIDFGLDEANREKNYRAGHRLFHGLSRYESYEMWARCKDGSPMLVRVALSLVQDDEGHPKHYISQSVDITRERETEERVRENEERLRLIAESTRDLIWVLDRNGRFTYINPASRIFHGADPEEMIGTLAVDWIHPDDVGSIVDELGEFHDLSEGQLIEYRCINKEGDPVAAEFRATVVRGEDGRMQQIIGSSRDVRERIAAEEERRELERQIQHTQKLESLGLLAGGIAHDFNNLLVAILGHANLAQLDIREDSESHEHLQNIETAALRASELTKQLLAYSGRGRLSSESIDMGVLVKDMVSLLDVSVHKTVSMRYELEDGHGFVQGDPGQIQQIVLNLITNASDAIGEAAGEVTVRTGRSYLDEDTLLRLRFSEGCMPGDYVKLSVSDSGAGMDERTIEHMFDPFFTTKRTGRGLGLAAIIGIVRSHGGAIEVKSKKGAGTTVSIYLPSTPRPERLESETTDAPANGNSGATLLVVDDEDLARNTAKAVLERYGYHVVTAANGREGVEVYAQQHESLAGIVLDLTMPVMNGAEAYQEMIAIDPSVRVLITSGFDEGDAFGKFTGNPPSGFLQKPYRPAALVDAIGRMLSN